MKVHLAVLLRGCDVKLEMIARGLFLVAALSAGVAAAAVWAEPAPQVLSGLSSQSDCRVPANARRKMRAQEQPDQDLLLVIFSLSQAFKS
jgi:hypothetical protein